MAVGFRLPAAPGPRGGSLRRRSSAAIPGSGPVLELGAGTGPVTQALLELGCPVDQIVVVERDAELCRPLEQRFSGLHVLHGNALELDEILAGRAHRFGARVLSGLPMRVVPPQAAALAIHRRSSACRPAAPSSSIPMASGRRSIRDEAELKLDATFVGREWRNLPPMGIWSYRLERA